MREIKFRGKRVDNGEWTKGWYYYDVLLNKHLIREDKSTWSIPEFYDYEVDPNTIGQSTGLKDNNGVDVCEGDIIHFESVSSMTLSGKGTVIYGNGSYWIESEKLMMNMELSKILRYRNGKVVGNIHDKE